MLVHPVPPTITADTVTVQPGHSGRVTFDIAAGPTARNVVFEIDLARLSRLATITDLSAGCLRQGAVADCAYVKIPKGTHQRVTIGFRATAPGTAAVTGSLIQPGPVRAIARVTVPKPVRKPLPHKEIARPETVTVRVRASSAAPLRVRPPAALNPPAVVRVEKSERSNSWWLATVVPAFLLLGLSAAVRRRHP